MKNNYNIEHILESFYQKGYTNFLNPSYYMSIINKLPKNTNIYRPYKDATKVIIYKKDIPNIIIVRITFSNSIRHQAVLKELFNLGLKEDVFGDIIIEDNIAYIYLLDNMYEYIKYNFEVYNNKIIDIEELDKDYLINYENKYEEIELQVSSLRIDNIISTITNDSRKTILDRFKNKDIVLNYNIVTKYTTIIHEGDIFSIRKYGKYKYLGIIKETKKGGYIIKIIKYI